jgi:hypothetical protein
VSLAASKACGGRQDGPSGKYTGGPHVCSVYGFVKQSGGNATIYSEPGRGTTVNLYLPSVTTADVRTHHDVADAVPAAATGETVLVVEDNPELRRLSLRRIKPLGYRVLEADSGPSALAVLQGGMGLISSSAMARPNPCHDHAAL